MARMAIGMIGGVPAVKVTKNDAHDPAATADNLFQRFLFNSRNEYGYVHEVRTFVSGDYYWGGQGTTVWHFEGGSGAANADWAIEARNPSNPSITNIMNLFALTANWDGFPWHPIVSARVKDSEGWFAGPYMSIVRLNSSPSSGRVGRYLAGNGDIGFMQSENINGTNMPVVFLPSLGSPVVVTVWDLPAMNDALQGDGGDLTNKKIVKITPAGVKIARPGYDCDTATGRQLILDSDRIPAKIIAAGVTELPPATTVNVPIATTLPLSEHMALDFNACYRRTGWSKPYALPPLVYITPNVPTGSLVADFDHRIQPDEGRIQFRNNSEFVTIDVRWVLFADDDAAPTTGGSVIMRKGTAGGEAFIQIKRPGSSDVAPNLNDIMLDTRLHALQIVTEGYLPVASFTETTDSTELGAKRKTVTFANGGFTPFVKFTIVFDDGTWSLPVSEVFFVTGGVSDPDNVSGKPSRSSGTAVIGDDYVRFYLSPAAPSSLSATQGGFGIYADPFYGGRTPVGIRYYIFALPI